MKGSSSIPKGIFLTWKKQCLLEGLPMSVYIRLLLIIQIRCCLECATQHVRLPSSLAISTCDFPTVRLSEIAEFRSFNIKPKEGGFGRQDLCSLWCCPTSSRTWEGTQLWQLIHWSWWRCPKLQKVDFSTSRTKWTKDIPPKNGEGNSENDPLKSEFCWRDGC